MSSFCTNTEGSPTGWLLALELQTLSIQIFLFQIVSHLPFGPTAFFGLVNVVMRHEIQVKDKISEAFPHLIFDNFNTRLGERVNIFVNFARVTCG